MKVGQEVYLKPIDGIGTRTKSRLIQKDTIKKIGRIYVTLEIYGKFNIKTGEERESDYMPTHKLYTSLDTMQHDMETVRLTELIRKAFEYEYVIELPKLQQIARIMGLSKSAEKPENK
jgi:hypothetical protein